jgi:glutathione S-transferase
MSDSDPLVLYDIASPVQPRSYAPNPSKARLALGFKCVPFKTTWVDLLDIPNIRKGLNCQATRKLDDGSDFYTLPMLKERSGKIIGDSFDIANYLEDTFPNSGGCLFPPNSTLTGLNYESPNRNTMFFAPLSLNEGKQNAAYANFNTHIDATFSANMILFGYYLPFNPSTAEAAKAQMVKRAHLNSWEDINIQGDARKPLMAAFRAGLTSLAQLFTIHDLGPYLEGKEANYADLIVGGWLNMLSTVMPKDEWEDFRTWHGGVLARLHDALQGTYFVCN